MKKKKNNKLLSLRLHIVRSRQSERAIGSPHTGEKTYICVLCDIIFKKRGYSKTHRYNNMANRYEAGHGHDAGSKNENSQNLHSNNQIHCAHVFSTNLFLRKGLSPVWRLHTCAVLKLKRNISTHSTNKTDSFGNHLYLSKWWSVSVSPTQAIWGDIWNAQWNPTNATSVTMHLLGQTVWECI